VTWRASVARLSTKLKKS